MYIKIKSLNFHGNLKIGNGKDRPVRYGFIGKIKLPENIIDNNIEFSILLRFSKRINHGHFQLWNMKFWNFYNGGYEILIHSKYWNTDKHDKYSIGFVAEELNADEFPELLFWDSRETVSFYNIIMKVYINVYLGLSLGLGFC